MEERELEKNNTIKKEMYPFGFWQGVYWDQKGRVI